MTDRITFTNLDEPGTSALDEFTIVVTKMLGALQEQGAVPSRNLAEYFLMQGVAIALTDAKMSEADLAVMLARVRQNVSRTTEMVRKRKANVS